MKMIAMTCPTCNAQINVPTNPNSNYCFCTYCGSQIYLDDGSTTYNYNLNYTYHEIDDAAIINIQSNERIKKMEIEAEERKNQQSNKMLIIILFCFALIPLPVFLVFKLFGFI